MTTKKKIILWASILIGTIILIVSAFLITTYCLQKVEISATVAQIEEQAKVKVEWQTDKHYDNLTIDVYHNDELKYSYFYNDSATKIKGYAEFDVHYGKLKVKLTFKNGLRKSSKTLNVNVTASEYVIAPLAATLPVTMFTLNLEEITNNYTIPTFVWFDRGEAWDYSNVPDNIYTFPNATEEEIIRVDRNIIYDKSSKFVKELYEISPNAKFHFYYNDGWSDGFVKAAIANNIPEENYDVVLLSDGTYSYTVFNHHFDNENANENYQTAKNNWETLKSQVSQKGYYDGSDEFVIDYVELGSYFYVLAKEESNIVWWTTRKSGMFAPNNAEYKAMIENDNENVIVKNINPTSYTTEQKELIKSIYHFSDNMFETATKDNKDIMIIIGTNTEYEYNFSLYVNATKKFYGEDYVYYYKGHPRYPAAFHEGRAEYLSSLGLEEVESTIPAELLFFFNENAVASGYQSTTFVSLDEHSCGSVWNTFKDDFTLEYKDRLTFFINKVDSSNEKYGSLVTNDNTCVLEFNDTTNYDIAIYDGDNDTLKYYKFSSETQTYVEV